MACAVPSGPCQNAAALFAKAIPFLSGVHENASSRADAVLDPGDTLRERRMVRPSKLVLIPLALTFATAPGLLFSPFAAMIAVPAAAAAVGLSGAAL